MKRVATTPKGKSPGKTARPVGTSSGRAAKPAQTHPGYYAGKPDRFDPNEVVTPPRQGLTSDQKRKIALYGTGAVGAGVGTGYLVGKSDDGWKWRGPVGDDAGERRFKRKETWPSRGKGVKRQLKPKKSGHAVRQYTPNRVP